MAPTGKERNVGGRDGCENAIRWERRARAAKAERDALQAKLNRIASVIWGTVTCGRVAFDIIDKVRAEFPREDPDASTDRS